MISTMGRILLFIVKGILMNGSGKNFHLVVWTKEINKELWKIILMGNVFLVAGSPRVNDLRLREKKSPSTTSV